MLLADGAAVAGEGSVKKEVDMVQQRQVRVAGRGGGEGGALLIHPLIWAVAWDAAQRCPLQLPVLSRCHGPGAICSASN